MTSNFIKGAISLSGIGGIEAIQSIELNDVVSHEGTIKLVLQLIITIASLVGLFQKKKTINT